MSDDRSPAALWARWRTHTQAVHPYKVCVENCPEGWPCETRRETEQALREQGIDPYAVLRGEVSLPTG
ncbi:hypothetical protein AB0I28_06285 [Phytomonospora sp. NPDC050363]|uniref:hypothetical protein n=1 Tax=Phytomonospora sp. NPDC050363 TaxID=3155642 RepID=UPI0033F1D31D